MTASFETPADLLTVLVVGLALSKDISCTIILRLRMLKEKVTYICIAQYLKIRDGNLPTKQALNQNKAEHTILSYRELPLSITISP